MFSLCQVSGVGSSPFGLLKQLGLQVSGRCLWSAQELTRLESARVVGFVLNHGITG